MLGNTMARQLIKAVEKSSMTVICECLSDEGWYKKQLNAIDSKMLLKELNKILKSSKSV